MPDLSRDIDSLNNFKRKTSAFLRRIRKTGEPIVLTINGKAKLVVQDAVSYQRLLDLAEQADALQFLRRSLADADAGRTKSARQAIAALGKRK